MESLVAGFAVGDGNGGGGFDHHNWCLHVKAAFAQSVKSPAKEAFAARAAIPVAVVWLWGELVAVALVVVENDGRYWSWLRPG